MAWKILNSHEKQASNFVVKTLVSTETDQLVFRNCSRVKTVNIKGSLNFKYEIEKVEFSLPSEANFFCELA